jgi:two-component sensor histidine kinase
LSAILSDAARVWPQARRIGRVERSDRQVELAFRTRALQLGFWAGWFSIIAVLADLALAPSSRHRGLVFALTGLAGAGNAAAMLIPWREWLQVRRGRLLLDLWSGGLIAFVATLVFVGGANYTLLLFLAVPFIALVQRGWRRGIWLATSVATCSLAAALVPLPIGVTAMRLALVAAAVGAALVLARAIRREAAAHRRANARAELDRLLAEEANHRIKNNLQTVSDLLLLGRPEDGDGRAFDDAASRIRSIATVHRLLTETNDAVDADALIRNLAEGAPVPVVVEAENLAFDPSTAQKLGIVTNELITNAFQHGAPPIVVRLSDEGETRLQVDDGGTGLAESSAGLGLGLVRRMVEQGLAGSFELTARAGGGTRAEVVFPAQPR